MEKILIAGGTGFVGKHLISFLAENGYSINVLTRKANFKVSENIQFFQWNVEQQYIDKKAFEEVVWQRHPLCDGKHGLLSCSVGVVSEQ